VVFKIETINCLVEKENWNQIIQRKGGLKGPLTVERESIRDWGKAVLKDRERITVELTQSKYKILELASPGVPKIETFV
jgi:hypothetical protein